MYIATLIVQIGNRKVTVNDVDSQDKDVAFLIESSTRSVADIHIDVPPGDEYASALGRLAFGSSSDTKKAVELLSRPLDDKSHPLTLRTRSVLLNNGLTYTWEVLNKTEAELIKMKNFGRRSLSELMEHLAEVDLKIDDTLDDDIMKMLPKA